MILLIARIVYGVFIYYIHSLVCLGHIRSGRANFTNQLYIVLHIIYNLRTQNIVTKVIVVNN